MIPAEIFEFITKYGPMAIFGILWWLERDERKDAQKELKQIALDQVAATTSLEKTISQWASIFRHPGERDR